MAHTWHKSVRASVVVEDEDNDNNNNNDEDNNKDAEENDNQKSVGTVAAPKLVLGTKPIAYDDNKSHHLIYRYTIPRGDGDGDNDNNNNDDEDKNNDDDDDDNNNKGSAAELWRAIARENVLDFFYPHTLESGGEAKSAESVARLKLRRDVFLLAFSAVQALDADDRWSFYQIAGIHGLPHAPYDGDEGEWDRFDPEWWGGYCQHGTPLFPTWHRPYVMLLEQSIIRQAKLLAASSISDKDEKAAVTELADELRIPYWDWASNSTRILGLPDIFTSTDVALLYPWKSFTRTSIPNPLKAFVAPRDVGRPFASSDVYNPSARPNYAVPPQGSPFLPAGYPTVRHVTPDYLSNNDRANVAVMRNAGTVLVEGVHALLQHASWLPFSNHFWSEATHGDGSQFGHYASLELVHDFVHGVLGGSGGHMSYPELAAFDPVFFFHHCNIDRLAALWQYCYPDAWIPRAALQLNHDGTYVLPPDSESLATTELTPFRLGPERSSRAGGRKFVNSDDVRLVDADCGYTYPEIARARREGWSPATMLEHLRKLYKPPQDYAHRWILVLDRVEKRAFNGTFQIRVFLGNPSADADTPVNSPNYAGAMTVFARATRARCANCERRKYMRASLDLTKTMVRLGITTAQSLGASADPLAPGAGRAPGNPFSAPGSITLVFVSLAGRQLDTSAIVGDGVDDGVQLALYYQRGVPDESINEFFVQNLNIAPTVVHKFVLPA